jgi:hypothetical protein
MIGRSIVIVKSDVAVNPVNVETSGADAFGGLGNTSVLVLTQPGQSLSLQAVASGVWQPNASDVYANATPTPSDVGRIPSGTTFDGVSIRQMLDMLLYGPPSFGFSAASMDWVSGSSGTALEVGDTIPTVVTFHWLTFGSILANSIEIKDSTLNTVLLTGSNNDGVESITLPDVITSATHATHEFRVYATATSGGLIQRAIQVSWRWRRYWGNSTLPSLDEAAIKALTSSDLATGIANDYDMAAGGYKFIAISNALNTGPQSVIMGGTSFSVPLATSADDPAYSNIDAKGYYYALVPITNSLGVTEQYRVYRTTNEMGSNLTLEVT